MSNIILKIFNFFSSNSLLTDKNCPCVNDTHGRTAVKKFLNFQRNDFCRSVQTVDFVLHGVNDFFGKLAADATATEREHTAETLVID